MYIYIIIHVCYYMIYLILVMQTQNYTHTVHTQYLGEMLAKSVVPSTVK